MPEPWNPGRPWPIRVVALITAAVICSGLTSLTTHASAQERQNTVRYEIHSLHPPGKVSSRAADINDRGWITGSSTDSAGLERGYIYIPGKGYAELGTLGGDSSIPTRINRSGQVVGMSDTSGGEEHGFAFTLTGGMIDLNQLLGSPITSVRGLNDAGALTGAVLFADQSTPRPIGYLYRPGLGVTLMTGPSPVSEGVGVNKYGDVGINVGRPPSTPYVYTRDGLLVPQDLPGGWGNGLENDINDLGQIVGFGSVKTDSGFGNNHGHVYTPGDRAWDLGTLGGATSTALRINDNGAIVGQSDIPGTTTTHAFLYTADERMVDLNTLVPFDTGWELTSATALNRDCPAEVTRSTARCGEIVGVGLYRGQTRGFLLIPKR